MSTMLGMQVCNVMLFSAMQVNTGIIVETECSLMSIRKPQANLVVLKCL